jgi:hypothetical protein
MEFGAEEFFCFARDLVRKPLHTPDQVRSKLFRDHALKRDDFSLNRHPALASRLSMIFSENRCTLFGIML